MTQKHGDKFKLTPEQILKIGVNENGKKFSTMKPATQEAKVREILNDTVFIDTMIKLSGFGHFEKLLHTFMEKNETGKQIRIENLLFSLKKLDRVGNYTLQHPIDMEGIAKLCERHFKVYNAILRIDPEVGRGLVEMVFIEVEQSVIAHLDSIRFANEALAYYEQILNTIYRPYFGEIRDWTIYPEYLCEAAKRLINKALNVKHTIAISTLTRAVAIYQKLGMLSMAEVETMLMSLITNPNRFNGLITGCDDNAAVPNISEFVSVGESLGLDMTGFLKFVVLNREENYTDRQWIEKYMIYRKFGEISLCTYLQFKIANINPLPEWFLEEFDDIVKSPCHQLDLYYLTHIQSR
ncbi:hypothetical protein EB093_09875 [bacterium]|nr:hypothetical protein [bacterium]